MEHLQLSASSARALAAPAWVALIALSACATATREFDPGEGGSGGAGGGSPCGPGVTLCGGACVDTENDPAHCGACDSPCGPGQICSGGQCTIACGPGTTLCGAECVDTSIDPAHCGGCNAPCGMNEVCTGGVCATTCAAGETVCDGACTDTQTDPQHCGACNDPCPPGVPCAAGACGGVLASCLAILQAGASTGDGTYTIDPDGPGGAAPFAVHCDMTSEGGGWTRCLEFVNTPVEDVNNNTWMDPCIDWSMAAWTGEELLAKLVAQDQAVVYAASGVRPTPWTHDQVTSTVAPDQQYQVGLHQGLVTLSNGDKLMISGRSAANSGCWGSMGNGYGIAVYPANPFEYHNIRFLVMPYRHQIDFNTKRDFGTGNMGWFEDSEISYAPALYDACGVSVMPAHLGSFELYVR